MPGEEEVKVARFSRILRLSPYGAGFSLASLLPLLFCADALAFNFGTDDGELTGSLDTTVAYGQMYRVQKQDKNNDDINTNDGNRNFSTGLVSNAGSVVSVFKLNYGDYGLTLKGRGYYDDKIAKNHNDYSKNSRTPEPAQAPGNKFPKKTRELSGSKVELLDAYVTANWDVFNHPFQLVVGKHVLNWGESMFYRGGVNSAINPLDLSTYRMMNYNLSDLKELSVPVEAVSFNLGITDNLSMEAFYQWKWKETVLPPVGTFFSETDVLADGASNAWADQAADLFLPVRDIYNEALGATCPFMGTDFCANGLIGSPGVDAQGIVRVANMMPKRKARDDGQFGISFKYTAESLNNTEFGLYFVNYHSKEPLLAGDLGGYQNYDMLPLVLGQPFWNGQGIMGNLADFLSDPNAAIERWGVDAGLLMAVDAAGSIRGWREYPENIRMYGFSFATELGGISWGGELTYRPNMPIGVMTTNDLIADMLYQAPFAIDNGMITTGITGADGTATVVGKPMTVQDTLHNYKRVEMFNTSLSAIKLFGAGLTFDSSLLLFNIASEHYRGDLTYMGYDTNKPIGLQPSGLVRKRFTGRGNRSYYEGATDKDQISRDAYGYTLSFEGTWNNVFGINLKPFVVYQDSFKGNSHMTGNFIEGAKAYSIGMRAELSSLEAEMQYTEFWGGGMNNQMRDRDNASFNVKYTF